MTFSFDPKMKGVGKKRDEGIKRIKEGKIWGKRLKYEINGYPLIFDGPLPLFAYKSEQLLNRESYVSTDDRFLCVLIDYYICYFHS
jgi:hypothetical protein